MCVVLCIVHSGGVVLCVLHRWHQCWILATFATARLGGPAIKCVSVRILPFTIDMLKADGEWSPRLPHTLGTRATIQSSGHPPGSLLRSCPCTFRTRSVWTFSLDPSTRCDLDLTIAVFILTPNSPSRKFVTLRMFPAVESFPWSYSSCSYSCSLALSRSQMWCFRSACCKCMSYTVFYAGSRVILCRVICVAFSRISALSWLFLLRRPSCGRLSPRMSTLGTYITRNVVFTTPPISPLVGPFRLVRMTSFDLWPMLVNSVEITEICRGPKTLRVFFTRNCITRAVVQIRIIARSWLVWLLLEDY